MSASVRVRKSFILGRWHYRPILSRPLSKTKLAAGAKVPLRPPAFRPTALPALPCRLLAYPTRRPGLLEKIYRFFVQYEDGDQ